MNELEQQIADAQAGVKKWANKKALTKLLHDAIASKNWAAVKIICEMKGQSKPLEADKAQIVQKAIEKKEWQDVFDIEKAFKKEDYLLPQGPLPKSIYTMQLEALTRELMQTNDFTIEVNEVDKTVMFIFKNSQYNWTEIRNYANFQHVTLNETDFSLYKNYLASTDSNIMKATPTLDEKEEARYKRALYQEYYRQNREPPSPTISFQEMQAINIYTGQAFYRAMNDLLRGEYHFWKNKERTREILITSVLCSSGLQKIPETSITDTYRGAKMGSVEEQTARVKAAARGGTVRLEGFISTSTGAIEESFLSKPIHYHFKNLRGIYIEPISQVPDDHEFLIPPTNVQLTQYELKDGKHCFEGAIVEDIRSLNVKAMETKTQAAIKKDDYMITQGPQLKSIYTTELEELARDLMKGNEFQLRRIKDDDFFMFNNGHQYNWTEIRSYANVQHVTLNDHDFSLYKDYLRSQDLPDDAKPNLIEKKETHYRQALYKDYLKQNKTLPSPGISYQEMQAINVYTGGLYKDINALLRSPLETNPHKPSVKAALINAVMCASGLQKVPETVIKDVYRGAKLGTPDEQAARVSAATQHGTIRLDGFVSTSIKKLGYFGFKYKPVHYHFTNVRGAYIAPISYFPREREFLMPPTLVQLNRYQFKHGKHCFDGSVVDDLASLHDNALEIHDTATRFDLIMSELNTKITKSEHITSSTIIDVFKYCPSEKLDHVAENTLKRIQNRLPEIIESVHDIQDLLKYCPPDQQILILMVIKTTLPNIIRSAPDLTGILKYCLPEHKLIVLDVIKDNLPEIIKPNSSPSAVLACFSLIHRATALEIIKDKLPELVKSTSDLIGILQQCHEEQQIMVRENIKSQLPKLIKSASDLASILLNYPEEQHIMVLESIKDKLPEIIQSASSHNLRIIVNSLPTLQYVLQHASLEQKRVLETIKNTLPDLIKSTAHAWAIVQHCRSKEGAFIFNILNQHGHVKMNLPNVSTFLEQAVRFENAMGIALETANKLDDYLKINHVSSSDKTLIQNAIEGIKISQTDLNKSYALLMKGQLSKIQSEIAFHTYYTQLANMMTTCILPVKQKQQHERKNQGFLTQVEHVIGKLTNQENNISQITKPLRTADPLLIEKMKTLKTKLNIMRSVNHDRAQLDNDNSSVVPPKN